jgi:hypothetical protein
MLIASPPSSGSVESFNLTFYDQIEINLWDAYSISSPLRGTAFRLNLWLLSSSRLPNAIYPAFCPLTCSKSFIIVDPVGKKPFLHACRSFIRKIVFLSSRYHQNVIIRLGQPPLTFCFSDTLHHNMQIIVWKLHSIKCCLSEMEIFEFELLVNPS